MPHLPHLPIPSGSLQAAQNPVCSRHQPPTGGQGRQARQEALRLLPHRLLPYWSRRGQHGRAFQSTGTLSRWGDAGRPTDHAAESSALDNESFAPPEQKAPGRRWQRLVLNSW